MNNKKVLILSVLFLSSFLLVLLNSFSNSPIQSQNTIISPSQSHSNDQVPKVSSAQYIDESLKVSSNFSMLEFAEDVNTTQNLSSINFTLPSSTWNVTNIELNFTDINLGREIKTIEDGTEGFETIDKDKSYAVQINITEPTTIFAISIYGYIIGSLILDNNVSVQIQGYDVSTDEPNGTIYGSVKPLNMTIIPDWYVQTFPTEVKLPIGKYYLVVNGSEVEEPKTKYHWFKNELTTDNLYIWDHDGNNWKNGRTGETFLYKLVQRTNKSYDPEEINMTVEVNGQNYKVYRGLYPYTGNATIQNIDFAPNDDNLFIPVNNNQSVELNFNLSYSLIIKTSFYSEGAVLIKESSYHEWTLNPQIPRYYNNCSVKFEFPKSWFNPNVNRTEQNITDQVIINEVDNYIIIPNNTIIDGASWVITFKSPNIGFTLDVPKTKFEPGQELIFTAETPGLQGNLTYVLINALGFEEYTETAESPPYQNIFSYIISSSPHTGTWNAYVSWNNETDAGIQTQGFIIAKPLVAAAADDDDDGDTIVVSGIDPQLIILIVLIIILSSIACLTSYQVVKKIKRSKSAHRELIFNKYNDVLNLEYIIIAEKKSGINVYEQVLAGKEIEITLIAGFLEAIRNFGIELSGSEEHSQTIKLEYQNMKILMSEFKNFRIINIMKENPSSDFYDALDPLSYDIDRYYGKSLKDFDGEITQFEGLRDLIEDHLNTSLVYPLKAVTSKDIKLDIQERILVNKALDIMKQKNTDHFYVASLMPEREFNAKRAEMILKLVKKKVFQPLN